MTIDTHCHLTHDRFEGDRDDVIARARDALAAVVTIGTGVSDGVKAVALADAHPDFVFATCGLDPFSAHRAGEAFDDELAGLSELVAGGRLVAVGEIGLDYHYDLDPHPVQISKFEAQLDIARDADLPVVIHVREAHGDLAAVLAKHPHNRGVVHSFTAGPREAERYLELGWYLAFNGVATFKNAGEVRDAARIVPADKFLVETDAPYLAPVPHRGRRCEPAHVRRTLEALAAVREQPVDELVRITSGNARSLFGF